MVGGRKTGGLAFFFFFLSAWRGAGFGGGGEFGLGFGGLENGRVWGLGRTLGREWEGAMGRAGEGRGLSEKERNDWGLGYGLLM